MWGPLDGIWQDIRFALRLMRRSPGFTAVAVLSLALGIGANTAIFSLVNTLMLRMLPVSEPERLVEILLQYPGEPHTNCCGWRDYERFRDQNHVFSGLVGASTARFNMRGEQSGAELVPGEYVTGDYFTVLGVKPAIGRLIGEDDNRVGAAGSAVAVVSWTFWKTRFNLAPSILGTRLVVDNVPVTVIGVAPPAFFGLQLGMKPDVWLPVAAEALIGKPSRLLSRRWGLALMGRLKPGASLEQAQAELTVLYRPSLEEWAKNSPDPLVRQVKISVQSGGAGFSRLREQFAKPLLALMGVVSLLMLMACVNVASMLLARGAARRHELALRVCLGAGRLRLMRQALIEALLLALAGTLPGIALAYLGAGALVRMLASGRHAPGLPERLEIPVQPDLHVLLFAVGTALLTGVLFGLAPAVSVFATAPASSLREVGRAGETRLRRLFGKSLVVAQVALSVVLLSAAGLFVRHLSNLQHLDLGFRRDHVLLVMLDPASAGYQRAQMAVPYQELVRRMEAMPGVRSVSITGASPISGAGASRFGTVEGHPERPEDRRYLTLNWVAPKYFETMGTPLLAGRDFRLGDQGSSRVAIVNRTMARYYFANGDPIGKHVTFDGDDRPYEIVGVVGDAKYYEIREDTRRTVYLNMFQEGQINSQFVLRTWIDPATVALDVRRAVKESLSNVPVSRVTTLDEQVDASIVPERLIATLSGLFGVLGSLLAAVGIYGLLAYTVARRINEIGIRMALGATRSDVLRMVLGDALGMVGAGLLIGIPIAIWGRGFVTGLMTDLPVTSVEPLVVGGAVMIAVGLLAAYVPGRRAARVDPMQALRYE